MVLDFSLPLCPVQYAHLVFLFPLCVFSARYVGTGASSLLLTCSYHVSLYSVCFTDATLTDSLIYCLDYLVIPIVVVVCIHDIKFWLSSLLKAAFCARCSSELPSSKQGNKHSFTIILCFMVCCSPQSQSGEAM